jgi:hypothetical protein
MRSLLKHTVQTVIDVGLVDLAVQAVDGTKAAANAAGDQTYDAAKLERLLAKTEDAIGELETRTKEAMSRRHLTSQWSPSAGLKGAHPAGHEPPAPKTTGLSG